MSGLRCRRGNLYSSLPIPLAIVLFLTLFAITPENISSNSNGSNLSEFVPVEDMLNITENFTPADNGTVEEFVDMDEFLANETLPGDNMSEVIPIPEENITGIPPEEFVPVDEFADTWEVYSLAGTYAEVEAPEVYPGRESFSVEAWIKTSDLGDGVAVGSGEYGEIESYWAMGKYWSGDFAPMFIRLNDGSDGEIFGVGSINLADGKWHYIVFVRDTGVKEVRGYVDGIEDIRFNDTTTTIIDSSQELMVGNADPSIKEWFVGNITGLNVYQRALSADEIAESYGNSSEIFGVDG